MCLIIEVGSKPLIAEKDIRCYKFVESDSGDIYKHYRTPYRYADVVIGETYKSDLNEPDNDVFVRIGLHSLANRKYCDKLAENFTNYYTNHSVVTCIIPKGSRYYIGVFDGHTGYASDCIVYKKIIKVHKFAYKFKNKKPCV